MNYEQIHATEAQRLEIETAEPVCTIAMGAAGSFFLVIPSDVDNTLRWTIIPPKTQIEDLVVTAALYRKTGETQQ